MDGVEPLHKTSFSPRSIFVGFLLAVVLLGAYTNIEVLTCKTKSLVGFSDLEVARMVEKVAELNSKLQQLAVRQSRIEHAQDKAAVVADNENDRSTSSSNLPTSPILRGRNIFLRVMALEKEVGQLRKRLQQQASGPMTAASASENAVPDDLQEHEKKERLKALIRQAALSHPEDEVKRRHRRQAPPGPPAPLQPKAGKWRTALKALQCHNT